jgi:hypothetical protein
VNTRAGTSLPVDKGAYGPILFRASACGRKKISEEISLFPFFLSLDCLGRSTQRSARYTIALKNTDEA